MRNVEARKNDEKPSPSVILSEAKNLRQISIDPATEINRDCFASLNSAISVMSSNNEHSDKGRPLSLHHWSFVIRHSSFELRHLVMAEARM